MLIINRLVYNVLSHNPIVFKFSQKKNILLSFASLQSFEIIPTSGNNLMDIILVCKWLLSRHDISKLCYKDLNGVHMVWTKFGNNSSYQHWVNSFFLYLGSVPFWSVKCSPPRRKKWTVYFFLPWTLQFPKMYTIYF